MEHFTELLGDTVAGLKKRTKGTTLPPSGNRNRCTGCLHASHGCLKSVTILTVELKANLHSVTQHDVGP